MNLKNDDPVPNILLNPDFNDFNFIKHEFTQKLKWFEDEFDELLGTKTHNITEKDIELAHEILDRLSETINEYRDEDLCDELVSSLNNIEKNHLEFF